VVRNEHLKGKTMTTLQDRPNTALLVIDVQSGIVAGNHERDAVVANVGSLVEKARREQVPVVWVQHSDEGVEKGSDGWQIVPELAPAGTEPLVEKSYGDSFEDSILESVLSGLGSAAAGPGHRPHEPVLDLPDRAGPHGRDGPDQGRRLQRHAVTSLV
jgi:isochorismate hydrolase